MKNKPKVLPFIIGGLASLLVIIIGLFLFCTAINIHNPELWILITVALFIFIFVTRLANGFKDFGWVTVSKKVGSKGKTKKYTKFNFSIKYYIAPIALAALTAFIAITGSTVFNALPYSSILKVVDSDFTKDLSESVGTDSIALMDTASAQMLGDREIGALSDVVSQFDVSYDYIQIDYNGKPIKVSALEYAGFFKWINNRDNGVKGYVTVNPVSMSASFEQSEGMRYIPSAYFFEDAYRYIWLKYPTLMIDNLHFEIDESGKPYYVASINEKTISLFGGKTVTGCIVLDPVSGETVRYDLKDIPNWIDVVFNGDLICEQYNWFGMFQNGYLNSLFGKKGCKQVTTYTSDDENSDETPACDFGYVSKDGDIWIYTGVTSVNGDSSNIGFLLANERTGESRYYSIAGADEKSAMAAAEGEVQEKGYQASFPSLINIDGHPTYIMVLKDSGGLVKLYAAVNVEQYNLVTTAATQAECISKYKSILGISEPENPTDETKETTVTIASIKYIDIDGNTFIYLIDTENNIFKAKAATHENMLLLTEGDTVKLSCSGSTVVSCDKLEK
ncbi:MAG: hypothetical protein IJF40_05095 [Clostridia bacterium]|nr:hypothetical protein [Clostridia bacterium]MBQ7046677.1 hypothetical protein [Oscillospiraceae bacterium]